MNIMPHAPPAQASVPKMGNSTGETNFVIDMAMGGRGTITSAGAS